MNQLQSRMNPQRRADARQMLVQQATPVATPGGGRRFALAGALAMVVAAVGAVAFAVRPEAPPPNYAGWTAVPQAAPPLTAPHQEIEQWASKCSGLGVGGVGVEGVPARPKAAARREVLVDRRGGFTYCVDVALGSGTRTDPLIALSGLKAGRDGLNKMWTTVSDKPFAKPHGSAVLVLGGDVPPPEGGSGGLQAFQMYGLSGPAVSGVDVVLRNGLRITATLRNGIWGVWWPGDRGDATGCRLEVHTPTGVTTADPESVRLPI